MESLVAPALFNLRPPPSEQAEDLCMPDLKLSAASLPSSSLGESTTSRGSDHHPGGSGSGLRGLMACRDIRPGDTVISVPLDLIISYDYIMASDLGRVLARY